MAERRLSDKIKEEWGITAWLAVLYTVGFLGMVAGLFFVPVPKDNQQLLNTVVGIMGTIQVALMSYFYGFTKGAATAQAASDARKQSTDLVLQDIAKQSAPVAAAAVAAATTGVPVTLPVAPAPAGDMTVTADNVVVTEQRKA
jgi:hypothetical protein